MAWLSMRKQRGCVVLRLEDLDPERSRPEYIRDIMDDLRWLGLDWDEGPHASGEGADERTDGVGAGSEERGVFGPYRQSRRLRRYEEVIADLRARGLVYPCYCTRKELRTLASAPHIGDEGPPYPGTCRTLADSRRRSLEAAGRRPSLRLDAGAAIGQLRGKAGAPFVFRFTDAVMGEQALSMRDCGGDFVLRRSDGVFAYQLAVAVDDADMAISEVLRGEDLLLSTPRQILLFHLLGATPPRYAHIPLLRDAAGERLAKRHRSLELAALRRGGARSADVLARLGALAGCLDIPLQRGESRDSLLRRMIAGFSPDTLKGRRFLAAPSVCGAG
jgi:glutamyl-tRNA synthetase